MLNQIFIVLAQWNNNPWVDMSLHLDTLSRFRANESFLLLLNAVYLVKKQQTLILVFGLSWFGLKLTIYHISTLTIKTIKSGFKISSE